MKRRPCCGKFEKDTLMVMIWHERKDAGKLDRTLFEVPCDDKSIADCVQEKFKKDPPILYFLGVICQRTYRNQ